MVGHKVSRARRWIALIQPTAAAFSDSDHEKALASDEQAIRKATALGAKLLVARAATSAQIESPWGSSRLGPNPVNKRGRPVPMRETPMVSVKN
jgi:hypothetical protein